MIYYLYFILKLRMSLFAILHEKIIEFVGVDVLKTLVDSAPSTIIEYNPNRRMYCVTGEKMKWLKEVHIIMGLDTSRILENVKWSSWGRYSYINNDLCNCELDEKNRVSGTSINREYETNILSKSTKLKLELEKSKYMTNLILLRKLY